MKKAVVMKRGHHPDLLHLRLPRGPHRGREGRDRGESSGRFWDLDELALGPESMRVETLAMSQWFSWKMATAAVRVLVAVFQRRAKRRFVKDVLSKVAPPQHGEVVKEVAKGL